MATKLAFTTMRDDLGKPLFWRAHWQRLVRSCEYFSLKVKLTESQLYEQLVNLWSINKDAIVRVDILDNGEFELTPRSLTCHHSEPLVKLQLSTRQLSERAIPNWLKSGDYSDRMRERENARELGFDEVLYLDENSNLCETTVSNLIWLKEDKLFAPVESKYFLQGIATSLVQASHKASFDLGHFKMKEILNADAAWILNAVTGPQRIGQIDSKTFTQCVPQLDLDQLYWELIKADREERQ